MAKSKVKSDKFVTSNKMKDVVMPLKSDNDYETVISDNPETGEKIVSINLHKYLEQQSPEDRQHAEERIVGLITEFLEGKRPDIRDVLAKAKPKALTDLLFFNLANPEIITGKADLFNALLNGKVTTVQSFNKKGVGRRVFVNPTEKVEEGDPLQTYTLCKDGKVEPWNITIDNLNNALWIPLPEERTGFGLAHEALMTNRADFIRCDDWDNPYKYLKKDTFYIEGKPQQLLVDAATGDAISLSQKSMNSRNWIIIQLPKEGR